jgi:hypothetical protein
MDNQDSSPQIIFPSVPDDFCPTGNWTEILQEFIDEVLSNGTINVPGLGDVTPQEIQNINEELDSLISQVDALKEAQIIVRYGTINAVPAADSVQTVTFDALPDTTYGVSIVPVCGVTIGTAATPLFSLNTGSKTTTSFGIRVENNISQITSIDWMAVYTP